MSLDELHRDLLGEVFNLGAGRAAASLAELLGNNIEIELSVPHLEILSLREMAGKISVNSEDRFCGIALDHEGDLTGTSILVYSEEESLRLVNLLMGGIGECVDDQGVFTDLHQDALLEVGNLVLNACLASVANFLKVEFEANVPSLRNGSCEHILSQNGNFALERKVLYVQIAFGIEKEGLDGHIGLCLDTSTIDSLCVYLDRYLDSQLGG